MSRFSGLLLILIGASTMFSACSKKTVNTTTPLGEMNAVITGNQWEAGGTWTSTQAIAVTGLGQSTFGYTNNLLIAATQTTGTAVHGAIELTINNYQDTAGTFVIDNSKVQAEYLTLNPDTVLKQSLYGTITITKGSATNVYGYFSFTTGDSTKVTNGAFNINIVSH